MGTLPDFCRNQTLLTNESSYSKLSECWTEKHLTDLLRICLPLIILPISLISNILSFLALRSRQMRGTTTTFFMLILSALDPLVLITKNLLYFPTFLTMYASACKLLYFLIYVLGYTNVWILVIMTGDKFFAVWFPLKAAYMFNISQAKYVCIALLFLFSFTSLHHFWTITVYPHPQNPKKYFCFYDMNHYASIHRLWRFTDFLIWCCLPFILILTLSVLIIYKLRQNRSTTSQQRTFDNEFNSKCQSVIMRSTQKIEVVRSRHRHITLMLLAVAVVFLCLTLPNSIYFVLEITYNFNQLPNVNDYSQWVRYHRLKIVSVIMFQISDLQHATNFFLYLLTSDKFRRAVLSQFPVQKFFRNSRKHLSNKPYGVLMRSSVSEGSSMVTLNPRYRSFRDPGNRFDFNGRRIPSKSLTITTSLETNN